ncbi:MAG: threonine synthase [Candidatus Odinarchaeia archaeon]
MANIVFLECRNCGNRYEDYPPRFKCTSCGGLLEYKYEWNKIREKIKDTHNHGFWRFSHLMPFIPQKFRLSLGEGDTPLWRASRLSKKLNIKNIFLKDETRNPTNSFRDRAAALTVSNANYLGFKKLVCISNGNLGASVAAYSAKAGLKCDIYVPKQVHLGKLAQMYAYGAKVIFKGNTIDETLDTVLEDKTLLEHYLAAAELNPLIIEAQKTIAFEIIEQYGVPDYLIVPMGDGGTLYSIWKGFKEYVELEMCDSIPKMIGVQAEGCAPIVEAYKKGNTITPIQDAKTRALAILVCKPVLGNLALEAIRESGGLALAITDEKILSYERILAGTEGIFAEPASAATIACLEVLSTENILNSDDTVICLITASGLKAPYVLEALTKKHKTFNLEGKVSFKLRILRLLELGDSYGYEIWIALGKSISLQAIYQHLNELEERELISSYEKRTRKYYRITEKGKRVLRALDELALLL